MKVKKVKWFSVDLCRENPNCVFIFGDNTIGQGCGGQAQIRYEPNAHGVPTKKLPSMHANSFFSDDEFDQNKKWILDALNNIPENFDAIVFPEDGLGTGLADLPNKAPKTFKFLVDEINSRFGDIF